MLMGLHMNILNYEYRDDIIMKLSEIIIENNQERIY